MKFNEKLNEYLAEVGCTAKELSAASGISPATLSRYRSGDRVPSVDTEQFTRLCEAIARLSETACRRGSDADGSIKGAAESGSDGSSSDSAGDSESMGAESLSDASARDSGSVGSESNRSAEAIRASFLACEDIIAADRERLRQNFSALVSAAGLNISKLCRQANYDVSAVFRFRSGERQPSDPEHFVSDVAAFAARELESEGDIQIIAQLTGADASELGDRAVRYSRLRDWLLDGSAGEPKESSISGFLSKLDSFDLGEYIKAIKFDELKVPTLPFQLPTSRMYYGLQEMMASELDFLKATVLSKSTEPVTLYSDMPMAEMAKDPEFPKKWMFGMAMMLKKGLHLNNIHNLDRSFDEMMLGLESWIPMYMTGQISPYYLKNPQSGAFNHFLRVSGAAALSGEAIAGYHTNGRYYLSKTKEDIAYYRRRANDLLKNASPLMEIYREERAGELNAFLLSDIKQEGGRRSILSAPPLYTMQPQTLDAMLRRSGVSDGDRERITTFAASQLAQAEQILSRDTIEDEIPQPSDEEFARHPAVLPLSGLFYGRDIIYTSEEYREHLAQTDRFAAAHPRYTAVFAAANPFRNLSILMHEGRWAMISKGNAPAIHFVIHHPRLRAAIESFTPPMVEE